MKLLCDSESDIRIVGRSRAVTTVVNNENLLIKIQIHCSMFSDIKLLHSMIKLIFIHQRDIASHISLQSGRFGCGANNFSHRFSIIRT